MRRVAAHFVRALLTAALAACGAPGELDSQASAQAAPSMRDARVAPPTSAPSNPTDALDATALIDATTPLDVRQPSVGPDSAPEAPPSALQDATPPPPDTPSQRPDAAPPPPDAAPRPLDAAPPPPDAAPPPPVRVAVISDLNGSYGDPTYDAPVHTAVRRIIAERPDVVLCTGDMVAGQRAGLDYEAMWAGFHAAVTDPLTAAGIPLAVSPGNHDASAYAGFENERRVYAATWQARRPAVEFVDDADYPFRYSFRVGSALFVALDDTRIGALRAADRGWVEARLTEGANVQAKLVFGHVPIHPFTIGREDEVLADDALEDLLIENGVSAFLSGHHHGYYPGRHRGLRHVSMACLGSGARPLIGTAGATPRALAFLSVHDGEITELEAYSGAQLEDRIERSSLPRSIGVLTRDDL